MKARVIVDAAGKYHILYSDGTMSKATNNKLYTFLSNFKNSDKFYGKDGSWMSPSVQDMSLYPGTTCAFITDNHDLIIHDFSPFFASLEEKFDADNYISPEEYGARHNRSPQVIKVYCRDGRLIGAKQIGNRWLIPENAPYPITPTRRREDIVLKRIQRKE